MSILEYTKQFALTNKIGSRLNKRGLLFLDRHDQFLAIYTEDKNYKVRQKFIKASTRLDAEDQFRSNRSGVLDKDYVKPNNVKIFQIPKDRVVADAYKNKLTMHLKKLQMQDKLKQDKLNNKSNLNNIQSNII